MKTTLKELDVIKVSLSKLLVAKSIPVRVSYRAAKFSKAVAKEITELEEQRMELVKKFGHDEGQGNLRVLPENEEAFKAAYDTILDEEIELPDVKIKIDDLANTELTMLDISNLEFMLVEVDPTEKK